MKTSRRLLFLSGFTMGLGAAAPILASPGPSPIRLRAEKAGSSLRINLESASEVRYRTYYLGFSENRRFVIDLEPMTLTTELQKTVADFRLDSAFARNVRVGQFKENTVRLVIDLADGINAAASSPTVGATKQLRIALASKDAALEADPLEKILQEKGKSPAPAKEEKPPVTEVKPKSTPTKPVKKKKQETLVVVIDPGHGGADPGAVGRRKTKEKNVVLAISKLLAARINATAGMKAYLTRRTDVFLPLYKRAGLAIKHRAHLFVSVHADAWTTPRANGSSVFTLSTHGASSLQARWLAQTQNKSDEIGGMDFRDVASQARSTVVDMLAETKLRYGIQLGDAVLEELARLGPLHKSTVEYAEFAVLKAQGVPSILVETAFISNPKDEKRLTDKREQQRFATAIYKGIITAVDRDPSLLKQS